MRFKDLAVGKYVTLNRCISKYYNLYCETLEIVSLSDTKEENVVGCRRVTRDGCVSTNNKYADETITYINYIHLREVNVDPYACLKWNKGDVLVPTEIGVERLSKPQLNRSPYVVVGGTIWYDRYRDRNVLRVCTVPSDGGAYSPLLNVAYFKKANNVWRGFFATQYYKGDIKFSDDGKLVKPTSVVKGSPVYNQIIEEAKACGIIKG